MIPVRPMLEASRYGARIAARLAITVGLTSLGGGCLGPPPPLTDGGGSTQGDSSSTQGDSSGTGSALDFAINGPCIYAPDEQLADFVDTATLTCSHDATPGNGAIPPGVTLSGCEVMGEPAVIFDPPDGPIPQPSVRYQGVWAFVLQVEDDTGQQRHVPVCMTYEDDGLPNHSVVMRRQDGDVWLGDPSVATFELDTELTFGSLADPVFVISRTDGPENLEFDYDVVSYTDSPMGAPQLKTLDQQHEETVLDFWLEVGPATVSGQAWARPFVMTADLVFCAEYSSSAACTPEYNLEYGSVAVTHSVVFWPPS